MLPADLAAFLRWIGIVEVATPRPQAAPSNGTWYGAGEVPF